MPEALTPRQEAFCQALAMGGSAAAAARAAGYSAAGARTQAWRLLQNRDVCSRLFVLRTHARDAAAALAARFYAEAEALHRAAIDDDNHGLALRALNTKLRIVREYGPPVHAVLDDAAAVPEAALAAVAHAARVPDEETIDEDAMDGGPEIGGAGQAATAGDIPPPVAPRGAGDETATRTPSSDDSVSFLEDEADEIDETAYADEDILATEHLAFTGGGEEDDDCGAAERQAVQASSSVNVPGLEGPENRGSQASANVTPCPPCANKASANGWIPTQS